MKNLTPGIMVCKMPKGIPFALVGDGEIVFPVKNGFKKVTIEDLTKETPNQKGG